MRGDARPHQRLLLVPQSRQRLLGVQAAVLLPLLRRLGRLGGRRHRGGAPPLRAQAARLAADVGGGRRARRAPPPSAARRSEEHTTELQPLRQLASRLLLEKKNRHPCSTAPPAPTPARRYSRHP